MPMISRRDVWWRALAVLVVLAVASGCGGSGSNPNVRRGRDLLAIGEADAAVRELRIALKAQPSSREAKALLLVALMRADDSLNRWYEGQILFERLRFLRESKLESLEGFSELEKLTTGARQELYDKGLDSKDGAELFQISREAAAYSFRSKEATDEERDYAAFALAVHDDSAALAYLVDRLKSEKATYIPDLLARLGAAAESQLMDAIKTRENLARPRALDTLARLRARQASENMFKDDPALRGLRDEDRDADLRDPSSFVAAGLTRDQALYGVTLHDDDADAPLRTLWAPLDKDGTQRLLVIQAFDERQKGIVTRAYHFVDGRLSPLELGLKGEASAQLAGEGPIVQVSAQDGRIRIAQRGRGAVPVEVEQSRDHYAKGDRVRIRKISREGTVEGTDEFGLLTIRLDEPHRGMDEMSLTASAVRGLYTVMKEQVGLRPFDGKIVEGRLELTQAGNELLPIAAP
jgi:hypothetical protein